MLVVFLWVAGERLKGDTLLEHLLFLIKKFLCITLLIKIDDKHMAC